jgi:hypothetical protein
VTRLILCLLVTSRGKVLIQSIRNAWSWQFSLIKTDVISWRQEFRGAQPRGDASAGLCKRSVFGLTASRRSIFNRHCGESDCSGRINQLELQVMDFSIPARGKKWSVAVCEDVFSRVSHFSFASDGLDKGLIITSRKQSVSRRIWFHGHNKPGMIPSDYLRTVESFTKPLRLGSLSRRKSYSVKSLAPNRP